MKTRKQCPLCGSELSDLKYREIEARLAEQRATAHQEVEAEIRERLRADFDEQLANQRQATEKRAAETIKRQLGEQRQALEKERIVAVGREQTVAARNREALIRKVQLLEVQLKRQTANELGDSGEIDLYDALLRHFPEDQVTRVAKGRPGADIVQEFRYKGATCGRIILDAKNRQSWQTAYLEKLRDDKVAAAADHAILASRVFPAGRRELWIESGVIVVAPARAVYVVQLLRQAALAMHLRGLSVRQRATKMARLYELIVSEGHRGKLAEAGKLAEDLVAIETQEKRAHDQVWKRRGVLVARVQGLLREIDTEVAAVIEGGEESGVAELDSRPDTRPDGQHSAAAAARP